MNNDDIKNKLQVLCDFISDLTNYKVKPEYSTSNDKNEKVIVVQEQSGEKIVFFENTPMFNYYNVEIFANSIREARETSILIGKNWSFKFFSSFIRLLRKLELLE